MAHGSTNALFTHARSKGHEEYAFKLKEIEEKQSSEKNTMDEFIKISPKGELTSLDKKVVHLIACANLPSPIVDQPTFKSLLTLSDRENLIGYHHYADWVLPRMYEKVKVKVRDLIEECQFLSFTSDIWTGPTSFISLTAHGINQEWVRVKHILCVQPFSWSHNFEAISNIVRMMLSKWSIPIEKCHVFLRDEEGNMRKAFETGGFLHADCGAHKLNLVVNEAVYKEKEKGKGKVFSVAGDVYEEAKEAD